MLLTEIDSVCYCLGMEKIPIHPILVAASHFGSQRAFADELEIHASMISQIANGRRKVPARMCRKIETLTGGDVTCHDLRPDIFGPAPILVDSRVA